MGRVVRVAAVASAALLLAVSASGARAAADAIVTLDVEFAFDGTASMRPTIAQAQRDAEAMMAAVRRLDPGARFAVVAFRDPHYPAPEYEVLQPLTGDLDAVRRGFGKVRAVETSSSANVSSEGYNLAFQRSVSDRSLAWRRASRKVVVVFGDGEPHGAGSVGIRGCDNTHRDPHGLKSTEVLAQMRSAGRTLVMVRQRGESDTTLECYASLARLAAPGGAARDSGSADLVTPVVSLIQSSLAPLLVDAGPAFALTRTTLPVRVTLENRSGAPMNLSSLRLRVPPAVTVVSARGGPGTPQNGRGSVTWNGGSTLAPDARVTATVRVTTGRAARRLSFVGAAAASLSDGRNLQVSSMARVRVGRTLNIRLTPANSRSSVGGALSLRYSGSARSLVARTRARGRATVRNGSRRFSISVSSARVLSGGQTLTAVVRGTVQSSTVPACRPGTAVSVRLSDRDFVLARTAGDVIAVSGRGCSRRYAGDVSAR